MVTLLSLLIASTTCPPVTLLNWGLSNLVGTKALVLVISAALMVPFKTWYCRIAAIDSGDRLASASAPRASKAALDGARTVMSVRLARLLRTPWVELMTPARVESSGVELRADARSGVFCANARLARARRGVALVNIVML